MQTDKLIPCTPEELARVGVVLVDRGRPLFRCEVCGAEWSCGFRLVPGGTALLPGYHRCPNGCNVHTMTLPGLLAVGGEW